jgi:ribosomal-protein-alanine N-acetyltransferase
MTGAIDYRHVSILWAGPEHAQELAQLHGGLFEKAWDEPSFLSLLGHPGSTAFLARVGPARPGAPAETAGFILGQLAADEAEILTLGVHKDRQRHGIGRRLVEALGRAVKKAEAKRLFLEVGESNAAALGLYRGLGFLEVGRRKAYYERNGLPPEDALTLALTL